MEVEFGKVCRDKAIQANGKTEKHKDSECTYLRLEIDTKDNFKILISKDLELKDIAMVKRMWGSIEKIVLMVKDNTFGQTETITKENFSTT